MKRRKEAGKKEREEERTKKGDRRRDRRGRERKWVVGRREREKERRRLRTQTDTVAGIGAWVSCGSDLGRDSDSPAVASDTH